MRKIFSTTILIITIGLSATFAQNVESLAGIRLGSTSALTYKKMFTNMEAVELMLSGRKNGVQITALYEKHKPFGFGFGDNFYSYTGFGGHMGYLQSDPVLISYDSSGRTQVRSLDIRRKSFFTMGVDAIIGVEYHIYSIPLAVSMDFKPYVELVGMRYLKANVWDFGVSAKYMF